MEDGGMRVFFPAERHPGESRVIAVPDTVRRLVELGMEVTVEAGLGALIHVDDATYRDAGAVIAADRAEALGSAQTVVRVRPPDAEEAAGLPRDAALVGLLDPFNRRDTLDALAGAWVTGLAMEMIPRTTLAQKMDALSSQASLAGYVAVILAAERLDKVFPMMITPAGTLAPARVFIIGAGVAGLQAIATARRLGARVEAYDTRPAVAEQVQSLGARFVTVDLGETGQTKDGYAKALTDDQLERQREAMARNCAQADVVITTAQVFGRRAPRIVTAAMLEGMRAGSIVVDLAVESGGNVEGSVPDRETEAGGVRILGLANLPGRVAADASRMLAANAAALLEYAWDGEAKAFRWDGDDEIIRGCRVTHGGAVVHPALRSDGK
jgi:H+-translocating NAD(P) transhydrogenase subunit alpha